MVERANGYLETSYLPGRTFTSPADFNAQLANWLELANTRVVRRIRCAPTARWAQDKAAMVSVPPVAPSIGWRTLVRLPRDHYVRVDGNDYSVDPAVVGRRVAVVADLDTVVVTCAGTLSPPSAVLGQASLDHRPGPPPGSPAARVPRRPPAPPGHTRAR